MNLSVVRCAAADAAATTTTTVVVVICWYSLLSALNCESLGWLLCTVPEQLLAWVQIPGLVS